MNSYRGATIGGPSKATAATLCQKCLKRGHYSYECKAVAQERPYVSRPSRTQQLFNPKLVPKLTSDVSQDLLRKKGIADEQLAKKELERERGRKRDRDNNDLEPAESKRVRSTSSGSSASVSTISTNASRSPARKDTTESKGASREANRRTRRGSSDFQGAETGSPRYQHERTGRDYRARNDVENPPARGHQTTRSRSRDSYSSYSRSRSRSPREGLDNKHKSSRNYRERTISRSRTPPRQRRAYSPDRRDGQHKPMESTGRSEHIYSRERSDARLVPEAHREDKAETAPPRRPENFGDAPRERSLSPFSQRVALTKAINMGR